jgi:prevent-host-death family protein
MTTVGSLEAKTCLNELLERVSRGERISITEHGRTVAMLVPPPAERSDVEDTIKKLVDFGKGRSLHGVTIREMIEEGRRF